MASFDSNFQPASNLDESVSALGKDAMRDRFRGCLVGGAVGDALGYTVEFMGEHEIFSHYGSVGITSYELDFASGKALVSDDTQMTLFTATGLLVGRTQEMEHGSAENPRRYVADAYQDWLVTQETSFDTAKARRESGDWSATSWLVDVPELFNRRAPGNTCLSALRRHRSAGDTIDDFIAFAPQLNNSKGCGGVMRAAPVGLAWTGDSIYSVDVESAQIAAITHGHSLGYIPAAVLSHIVGKLAIAGAGLEQAVLEARDTAARLFVDDVHIGELTRIIDRAVELSRNDDSDLSNIHRLGEGWVGEEALAVGIYCALRHQDDFSAAVVAAVNHSGDSDSTGAVCGNILGALLGYEAVGEQWTQDLELLDVTLELADDLYHGYQVPQPSNQLDSAWQVKYVQCRRCQS